MGHQGRVDVIIPTFNRRALVVQAAASVLAQTYRNLICTVVDDGSTDGSADALRSLDDDRLRVVSGGHMRSGVSRARNLGISESSGAAWLAFLDSDDLWGLMKLERQLRAMTSHPDAGWSAVACANVDSQLRVRSIVRLLGPVPPAEADDDARALVRPPQLTELLSEENRVPAGSSSVLVSPDLLAEAGPFDPDLIANEDWDLWLRLAKRSPLAYIDVPLVACRIGDGQTSTNGKEFVRSAALVQARHFPGTQPSSRKYPARWQRELARRSVASGHRLRAAGAYLNAAWLGRSPGQLVYAAATTTSPKLAERRLRHIERVRTIPPGWEARTEQWLAEWRH